MKFQNRLTRVLTAMAVMAIFFFAACKKESSVGTPAQQQEFAAAAASTDADNSAIFDDVFDNVMGVNSEVAIGGTGVFGSANLNAGLGQEVISGTAGLDTTTCFTLSVSQLNPPNRFPLQVTIDFGTGCTGRDGRTRKGKIIIVYSGPLREPGSSATTTFDGYSINDIKVEGTHKITNSSTSNVRSFTIVVTGARITWPNGDFSEWNSERKLTQIEGLGTPLYPLDDVFTIEGGANGSVKKGDKFFQWETLIKEPLVKKFTCRWFVKGIVVFRKNGTDVAVLNYGLGDCDNKATLTVNGQTIEITLH